MAQERATTLDPGVLGRGAADEAAAPVGTADAPRSSQSRMHTLGMIFQPTRAPEELIATEHLTVGIGVLPMPLRTAAVTAMEIATIERMFPGHGRFGVGHGVQDWMQQAGARVSSQLGLMGEYLPAVRRLLAGEQVSVGGGTSPSTASAWTGPRPPRRWSWPAPRGPGRWR